VVHHPLPLQFPLRIRQESLGLPDLQKRNGRRPHRSWHHQKHQENYFICPVPGLNRVFRLPQQLQEAVIRARVPKPEENLQLRKLNFKIVNRQGHLADQML
jgi:hypothetical protein